MLKTLGQASSNLCYFQGMGEAVVEDMPFGRVDNLCDICQPAQRAGMDQTVIVTFEGRTKFLVLARRLGAFQVEPGLTLRMGRH